MDIGLRILTSDFTVSNAMQGRYESTLENGFHLA